MKKTLQFITRLTTALFFTILIYFILNLNPLFKISLGLDINYPFFLTLLFLALLFNLIQSIFENGIAIEELPSEIYKLSQYGIKKTFYLSYEFWRKSNNLLKLGLIPLFLLFSGLLVSIYFTTTVDGTFSIISIDHPVNNIEETENKIKGEFKAKENNLGIVAVRFSTEGEQIEDEISFRLKRKDSYDWYYENIDVTIYISDSQFYPLGFPKINDSQGKEYIFEVYKEQGILPVKLDDSENIVFHTKYNFPRKELLQDKKKLISYLQKKIIYSRANIWHLIPIFSLPTLLYLIFVFNKEGLLKSFSEKIKNWDSNLNKIFCLGAILFCISLYFLHPKYDQNIILFEFTFICSVLLFFQYLMFKVNYYEN